MARTNKNTPFGWGLSVAEYEKGAWGSTAGRKFKPPYSMQKRFITSAPGVEPVIWDEDAAFEEIARVYISYAELVFPILQAIPIGSTDKDLKPIYKQESIDKLNEAVYRAIQFACENKNVWERVTGYNMSSPSFSISNETTGWIFSSSAWGHAAWASLQSSDIKNYEICNDGTITYKGFDKNEVISRGWLTDEQLAAAIAAQILLQGGGKDHHGSGAGYNMYIYDTFTKLQDQFGNTNIYGKIWFVEDMEGYGDFKDGQSGLVYVENGSTFYTFHPEETRQKLEANDFIKLNKIDIVDFGVVTGGPAGVVHHFGDLDDGLQRQNFMDGAFVGQWYTFKIATVPYLVNVTGGTRDTRLEWTGFRVVKDAGGKDLLETVTGTTTSAAHTENGISTQQQIDNAIALLPSPLTGNYESQVDNLKVLLDLKDLTPGLTKEYTIPNSLTTATIGGCEVAMNYSNGGEVGTTTQGFDLRGWDKSKPLYLSMTYHSGTTYIWVEIKLESVAGDDTKLKITNFKSGAAGTEMNAFGVASIQFKGGK